MWNKLITLPDGLKTKIDTYAQKIGKPASQAIRLLIEKGLTEEMESLEVQKKRIEMQVAEYQEHLTKLAQELQALNNKINDPQPEIRVIHGLTDEEFQEKLNTSFNKDPVLDRLKSR